MAYWPPKKIRTRERWQIRGHTSPFENVTVSTVGAGSASTIVWLFDDGKPTNGGRSIVNVLLKTGAAVKTPANDPGTRLVVKLPFGLNV